MRSSRPTRGLEAAEGEEQGEEAVVEEGRLVEVVEWPEEGQDHAVAALQQLREGPGLAPGAGLEEEVGAGAGEPGGGGRLG